MSLYLKINMLFSDFRNKAEPMSKEILDIVDSLYKSNGNYTLVTEEGEHQSIMMAMVIVRVGIEVFVSPLYHEHTLMKLYTEDGKIKARYKSKYPQVYYRNNVVKLDDKNADIIATYGF